jgi:hypothetical protein
MNEEYVIDESWKAAKAVKAVEYDQTKKQTIVLEDGKPLFAWIYPDVNYSNLSDALSRFYPDAHVVVNQIQKDKWMGLVDKSAHFYKVVAIPFIY